MADVGYSRAEIVNKLARLFRRFEEHGYTFKIDHVMPSFLGGGRALTTVCIAEVWVFGSFARGASACGDLDLLVYLDVPEGVLPLPGTVRRWVLGNPRHVDALFVDTRSGDRYERRPEFSHAKSLWTRTDADWKSRVDEIGVDATAGRQARKTDALPFSLKRMSVPPEQAEALVDDIEAGVLDSAFIPIDELEPREHMWPERLRRSFTHRQSLAGRETKKMLPYVYEWLARHVGDEMPMTFDMPPFRISIGRPGVPLRLLDMPAWAALIAAPHLRRGEPNGLWLVERGPKHPVTKAFRDIEAWTLLVNGRVGIGRDQDERRIVQLFSSAEGATEEANAWSTEAPPGVAFTTSRLQGHELLRAIAMATRLDVDAEHWIPVMPDPNELARALRRILRR